MDACSVCYSTFSSEEAETVARELPCGHVACTQCLADCFEDENERRDPGQGEGAGVRCPECFTLSLFDSVQSVPLFDVDLQNGKEEFGDDAAQEEEEGEEVDVATGPQSAQAPAAAAAPKSKFAAFVSANKAESHIPTFGQPEEGIDQGGASGEEDGGRVCKVQGCSKRAVENVEVCPVHTKRFSVVSVSAMVHEFKGTKLSSVALKSDKVEVNRGGVAGAGEAGFDPDAIGERFRRQERLELGEAVALIEAVKNIFREENNMVELEAPVMVVGDVHGQYFDLLNILKRWRPDHNLLFLGDYVDRGQFSCEVILHLFALKLRHPDKVYLIRGNHECSSVSAHFGFKDECKMKYGLTVYYRFLLAFQTMPICALIATSIGRIFACHGGISPDIKHLSDIESIDRFAEPEMDGPLCDMLWADPLNEEDSHKLTDEEYQHFLDTDYVTNQVRGCSYMFGYHAVQRFLRDNRLMYMVRAHEVQEEGFCSHFPSPVRALAAAVAAAEEGDFSDEDSDWDSDEEDSSYDQASRIQYVLADTTRHLNPTVLTVFSAPNYCDRYRNKAAVLHIERPGYYTVNLLEAEPHPTPVKESDVNVMQVLAMGNTCPYMPTSFREFLKVAVELGRAVKPTSTHTSTVTEELAAAAAAAETLLPSESGGSGTAADSGSVDNGGDGGGGGVVGDKSPALPAPNSARRSSLPAGGGSGVRGGTGLSPPRRLPRDNEQDLLVNWVLPSSAPTNRRGPARMASAPALWSGGGGRRRRRNSRGSSLGGMVPAEHGESTTDGVHSQSDGRERSSGGKSSSGGGAEEEEGGVGSDVETSNSLFGVMSSLSRRSMRGLGLLDSGAWSPGLGKLTRQNTWSIGAPKSPVSEAYRRAHARDGINEMHPEILNRRISSQDSGVLDNSRASILSPQSTASVPPTASNGTSFVALEDLLFGPGGLSSGGGSKKSSASPAAAASEVSLSREGGGGGDDDPSPAPPLRIIGPRRQFSLDMSVGSPSANRVTENKSTKELAAMLSNTTITELASMDGDVEVDIDPTDAENDATAFENGSSILGGSSLSGAQLDFSSGSTPLRRSRDPSFDADGMMTPSPRSRKSSAVGDSPSPSQILFTHEEIVVLKLLFSLFDRGGKNFITRDDIIAYAEEGGDFAQLKEVDSFMEAIDADTDGKVGLSDYINFAARLKGIHLLQQQMQNQQQVSESLDSAAVANEPPTPTNHGELT
ncbi:unnamed protein product [Pylaiella littoralis]